MCIRDSDSTVATPVLTRPLTMGADLVVHSASKYLNGHGDVLAGAVVGSCDDGFWQRIRAWRRDGGAMLGTLEAWLLQRGMRTLFIRVARCSESAMTLARHFQNHPRILDVLYPGLPEHPGHEIATRQMQGGFGGMLSLRIQGGELAACAVAAEVKVFKRATSLGGVESLIEHRASIEGPATPVPNDLLRLSIGLEAVDDLVADIEQALGNLPRIVSTDKATEQKSRGSIIEQVLDDHIRSIVRERGGDLIIRSFQNNVLVLGMTGSPGAVIPLRAIISETIRHYLPEVTEIILFSESKPTQATVEQKVQAVLDDFINPAVADHGGRIVLNRIANGQLFLVMAGGCQGCAMAEMTLRQGIEPIILQNVDEISTVVDETVHVSTEATYFKTKKS